MIGSRQQKGLSVRQFGDDLVDVSRTFLDHFCFALGLDVSFPRLFALADNGYTTTIGGMKKLATGIHIHITVVVVVIVETAIEVVVVVKVVEIVTVVASVFTIMLGRLPRIASLGGRSIPSAMPFGKSLFEKVGHGAENGW